MVRRVLRVSGPFTCSQPISPPCFVHRPSRFIYLLFVPCTLPDPLVDSLQLQRVLRGIKRTQGSTGSSRLTITDHHMLIIYKSLCLPTSGFSAPLNLQFGLCQPSIPSSICRSATLLWILMFRLPAFNLTSRLPRLTLFGRATASTLAWAVLRSVRYLPSCSIYCTSLRPVTWSLVSPFIGPTSLSCPFDTLA